MSTCTLRRKLVIAILSVGLFGSTVLVQADEGLLEEFIGRWNVRVKTLQPEKAELTYTEVYKWDLDRKFLRGRTQDKSDGTEDVIYGTYDEQAKGYPFWIFSSTGSYLYLAPATWNANKRIMEWKNPTGWDIVYQGRCLFPDEKTRQCELIMKDWKGKVLLEQEWKAVRRGD